jgi:hypothetical protein
MSCGISIIQQVEKVGWVGWGCLMLGAGRDAGAGGACSAGPGARASGGPGCGCGCGRRCVRGCACPFTPPYHAGLSAKCATSRPPAASPGPQAAARRASSTVQAAAAVRVTVAASTRRAAARSSRPPRSPAARHHFRMDCAQLELSAVPAVYPCPPGGRGREGARGPRRERQITRLVTCSSLSFAIFNPVFASGFMGRHRLGCDRLYTVAPKKNDPYIVFPDPLICPLSFFLILIAHTCSVVNCKTRKQRCLFLFD